MLGGLGIGALLLPGALSTAPFLSVDTISIQGNDHISHGEVLALIGPLRGENMLVADLEAYRQLLMTSGWVKTATLRRVLPATIEVSVEERKAVGLARFGGYLYLIDRDGAVIDEYGPRFADVDLPIIDGLSLGTQVQVDERRSRLAASLIRELDAEPDLASRVSQIDVGDPYDAVVLLNDSPTLIHLGDERFVERLREYEFLVPTLRAHEPDIDYADMRFESAGNHSGCRPRQDNRPSDDIESRWRGHPPVTRRIQGIGGCVARREQYLVGLDVGTSKIAAIVGEAREHDESVDIIGIGLADAQGIRRGAVVNLEAAVESIKKASRRSRAHRRSRDRLGSSWSFGRPREGV